MKTLLILFALNILICQEYSYIGVVKDKKSLEPLIGVNITIIGSREGTITDIDGRFILRSKKKNPKVQISYIGYISKELVLKEMNLILLTEDLFESEIVNVYSDKFTFAQKVILNTIDKYQDIMSEVDDYSLNTYSKSFFYFPKTKKDSLKDDSLRQIGKEDEIRKRFPWLFESYKEVKFKKPNIINQKILKRLQGKAIPPMFNVLGSVNYENIYFDKITNFLSPLSSSNFSDFDYRYHGKVKEGNDSLFVIYAKQYSDSSLTFRLLIHDQNYILKRFDAKFDDKVGGRFSMNPFTNFRRTKNLIFLQEYEIINKQIFPINYEVNRIDSIGTIRHQEIYSNYKVGLNSESSDFDPEYFTVANDVDDIDSVTFTKIRPYELNELENKAYISSDTIYNEYSAFQKFMLFDGMKFFFFDYYLFNKRLSRFSDLYRYNPVEGHYLGLGFARDKYGKLSYDFSLGYSAHQKQFYGDISMSLALLPKSEIYAHLKAWKEIDVLDQNSVNYQLTETMNGLFAHENSQNYIYKKGFDLSISKRLSQYSDVRIGSKVQDLNSVKNKSNFSVLYPSEKFKRNLDAGNLSQENEIYLNYSYKEYNTLSLGALNISQFIKNGNDLDMRVIFNSNDYNALRFKRIELSYLKKFNLSANYQLMAKANVFYNAKETNTYNLYFPEVYENFRDQNLFSIAEKSTYKFASYDYFSIGSYLQIRRPWRKLGFRDFYISAMAYKGDNYKNLFHKQFILLNDKINYKFTLSAENDLLFLPLALSATYDTRRKQMSYFINIQLQSFD
jgi:hypothetical protein